MNKEPETFKTATFQGHEGTCLDMCCSIVQKCIQEARLKEEEFESIAAVTLVNAIFENIKEVSSIIPGIIDLYLSEIE